MQMTSAIASLHQEKKDPPSKNRVWGFEVVTSSCTGVIWPQVLEPHQEIQTTSTTTVSGVVEWLSKDPIGISGGLNQYVAFGNCPVMFRDPLGLCSEEIASVIDSAISQSGFWGSITGGAWGGSGRNVDQTRRYVDTEVLGTIDLQHVVSGGMAMPGTTTIGGFLVELNQLIHGQDSAFQIEDLISNELGANARNESLFGEGGSIGQNAAGYIINAGIVGGLYGNSQHQQNGPRLPQQGLDLR